MQCQGLPPANGGGAVAMSYCGHCGQAVTEAEQFCVACGERLRRPDESVQADGRESQAARDDLVVLKHGVGLLERRDPKTAVTVLEGLCAERPDWAVARAYLGIAYLRCTRVADARWELEESVRLAPDSFICRTKLAELLARLGFYDQALDQLDAAVQLPPVDADSRHAALELRQFCKEKSKGMFYRKTGYPNLRLGRFIPRHHPHPTTVVQTDGGR